MEISDSTLFPFVNLFDLVRGLRGLFDNLINLNPFYKNPFLTAKPTPDSPPGGLGAQRRKDEKRGDKMEYLRTLSFLAPPSRSTGEGLVWIIFFMGVFREIRVPSVQSVYPICFLQILRRQFPQPLGRQFGRNVALGLRQHFVSHHELPDRGGSQ